MLDISDLLIYSSVLWVIFIYYIRARLLFLVSKYYCNVIPLPFRFSWPGFKLFAEFSYKAISELLSDTCFSDYMA